MKKIDKGTADLPADKARARAGRAFVPTQEQRDNVEVTISLGLTEAEVCQLIKNPETGLPIDEKTLRKHFSAEIAVGIPKIKALVGNRIVATILGRPGGLTNEHAQATLMVMYARTRLGWKDTSVHEMVGKDGGPLVWHSYPEDDNL